MSFRYQVRSTADVNVIRSDLHVNEQCGNKFGTSVVLFEHRHSFGIYRLKQVQRRHRQTPSREAS